MNRFRGRKKAKDDLAAPRPSVESESSSPFKMFSKKKSQEEEPKPEVDIAAVLPSNDEFRTSLLMTGLSARFSMLREQDDPNTKVGKASDDSVLFPKRQSRMMDFGYNAGLGDIAEVESIRAPFARASFQSSDDAASTNGSIMGRSKPTEGNNLFGGRQKIYKIASGGAKTGAMTGRALYDDDVAQSSFQKWRQAEREKGRQSFEDLHQSDSVESEIARPESPAQPEYNQKRETNSTTSSGPSAARNSTAATSITSSQPASSVKDWQSFANTSRTVSPTPPVERSVTRTRRLYEQSLNQDLHDQQTSQLSRIDTLSRQRNLANRTPDLTPTVPSPASATFGDRFVTRSILAKASAPNLRSFTPPTSSQMSPVELNNKFPGVEEKKPFGATPPLSPPISETGEAQPLSVRDRTKMLARTSSQYDETRYAQRQMQMQQGREAPTNRLRTESNASVLTTRSRSPSMHRPPVEKQNSGFLKSEPSVKAKNRPSTFFYDDDEDQLARRGVSPPEMPPPPPPQVTVARPADHEHPAFRKSALPTPLALGDRPEGMAAITKDESPEDSPTLGPAAGGLSGMVRQHLRSDSGASSVYGSMPNDVDLASRFPPERSDAQAYEPPMTVNANAWETIERNLAMSIDGSVTSPTRSSGLMEAPVSAPGSARNSKVENDTEQETDDFARHLADGARRVRERLTSYVESDSSKLVPVPPPVSELPPPPRPNPLGILKTKSSRGSLIDRGRERETQGQSKAKKLLGLRGSSPAPAPAPAPASASPQRSSFDFNESRKSEQSLDDRDDLEGRRGPEDKEPVHAGLKAFRQARRELQRMKELEVQQRYQGPQGAPPTRERAQTTTSRAPSQERRPPPVTYNRMPSEEVRNGAGSRSASRAPSERDRSGSETSSGGRSGSRPPRLRNGSVPRDDHYGPMGSPAGPNGMPRQGQQMMRLVPGQDMRRAPPMPPQAYAGGNASPGRFNRADHNLNIQPAYGYDAGQPSPISPLNGNSSPYGPPGAGPPHRPYGPPYPGGVMRSRDMSEPSIKSPTSQMRDGLRVGPMNLNGGAASTPNLHANMAAPPLPPINPRRKNTNPLGDATMNAHHLPVSPAPGDDPRGGFRSDDDDAGLYRQRLRKATSEANGMNVRARSMRQNPGQPMVPPPMPPSMNSNILPGGMI
ncbi:hypothetical protein ACJ41O_009400 [Fusarium nematophilum]